MGDTEPTAPHLRDYQQILIAEFNYIAQTAFQANEDRARSSQFFLISFGTFLAALFSAQLDTVEITLRYIVFSVILLLLSVFGAITVFQLTRLRQAWFESVRAMNQLKSSLVREFPPLSNSFMWTSNSLPPLFKPNSIGFLLAIQVSLVSGLATSTAVGFAELASGATSIPFLKIGFIGVFTALGIVSLFYILPLKKYNLS